MPYDDMAALRRDALELLERNAYAIAWRHIHERGHDVSDFEIQAAFYFGSYAPSATPGRYMATHEDVETGRVIRVVFEVRRVHGGKSLLVITAYARGGP